ncbi:hypothetical protein [Alkalilacustris brevis]|uniref:hypothetical protein n=1 Tax=Alkalilacustris brevis TaxID=2026338 RepID=UPI000E0D395C|nr:hypothetical protein [Alkalilacustris brevis]
MKRIAIASLVAACLPFGAQALEPEISEFRHLGELAADGFEPFATSGVGYALFGMRKEAEMYLCFIADTEEALERRQAVLLDEILHGGAESRDVPNIPVICILTQ